MATRALWMGMLLAGGIAPAAAATGGEVCAYGVRLEPKGDIADFVDGSWGGGAEVIVRAPSIHRGLYWKGGGAYVNLRSDVTRTNAGTKASSSDYFRIYGGGRFQLLPDRRFGPYLEAHLALVRHSIASSTATGIGTATDGFAQWGFGYDVTGGVRFDPGDRLTFFAGLRLMRSFGLEDERASPPIRIDPRYLEGYAGIGWTFGFLDVGGAE